MSPDRWRQVEELYHSALARDPAGRTVFLREACRGDDDLRHEIQSLLEQTETGVLDQPLHVGPYRIDGVIGAGGMGTVYRARDTRLRRLVAIKISHSRFGSRFLREARAVAALNHPHICTLYDVGPNYLVMEYVEGQPLGGPLPVPEALRLGIQIADALAAAHRKGIIHRDLKPGNVLVTPTGVKVLDFGLAKMAETASSEEEETRTVTAQTEEGTVVGTTAYMSPEQAEGKPVDARTDIFSFGAVLYEMVTGMRAFRGETKLSVLSAVLKDEPLPTSSVRKDIPDELERIISRCLRKNAERRFQGMADLKVALEELKEESDSGQLAARRAVTPRAIRTRRAVPLLLVTLVIAATVAGWLWLSRLRTSASASMANVTFRKLTDQIGPELYPSLSPDGKSFVYASGTGGNWDIFSQRVGGSNPVNLTRDSPADDNQPAFSPNGDSIAFRSERAGGGIFVMGATGESVRRLTDFGYHPAWSPDGSRIVCSTETFLRPAYRPGFSSKLVVVDLSTGAKHPITEQIADAVQPNWSPHGHRIAFWSVRGGVRDIWTVSATGGHLVPVTHDIHLDWDPVWSPEGKHLYFASDRGGTMNLWRIPIDEKSGDVLGPAEPVTTPSLFSAHISLSQSGRQVVYVQEVRTGNIEKIGFDPERGAVQGQPAPITKGTTDTMFPALSPDGEWLAFNTAKTPEEIVTVRIDGTGMRKLTDDIYKNIDPRWCVDGSRIAFFSNRSGSYQIWTVKPDASGLKQLTASSDRDALWPVWSPDGTRIAVASPQAVRSFVINSGGALNEGPVREFPKLESENGWFVPWDWSAGGDEIAGYEQRIDGAYSGILVFSETAGRYRRITDFGSSPVWLRGGKKLLFSHLDGLYWVDREKPADVRNVLRLDPFDIRVHFTVSKDSRTIYFNHQIIEADVWLMSVE